MGVLKNIEIAGTDLSVFNCRIVNPGLFDAPERDVTKVSIPGRSGDLLLDNGRFKNVTVEYDCLIASDDAVRDFNNLVAWLKSMKGYQRIEECFHPDEYRLGIFYPVISAKSADRKTINFKLKADCKPQRFLKEGEAEYGNVIPGELHSQWTGWYRLPNVAYDGDVSISIRPVGDITGISTNDAYMISMMALTIYTPSAAVDAWEDGEFYDLTQLMTVDETYQIYLSTDYSWEVKTDILTESEEVYSVKADIPVENITSYESSPVFVIRNKDDENSMTGTYFTQFVVNGIKIRVLRTFVTQHDGCDLYIDSEVQDCYYIDDGVKKNANAYVSLVDSAGNSTTEFPKFVSGINHVMPVYDSTLHFHPFSAMSFIPRWYTI